MRPAEELLYDSEASFRLVDHAIEELNASGAELDREATGFLAGIDKLQQMHGHLRDVTSATEMAATDILDGMARASTLVEQLDGEAPLSDEARHLMACSLRDELGNVVNRLQFQDITGQQLKHIGSLLADMNRRISQVVTIFSPPSVTFAPESAAAVGSRDTGYPDILDRECQAVADEIFAIRSRKTA